MDYSSMMQGVPQMGMPYNIMQRPSDMSRPRHTYSYPYNSDPVFLMPQIPPPHHHRTMADHQSMVHAKQTEPKPRLAKDEVLLLETEFAKNPKPSSQRKREIAELLKVDNPRINNWFQNRRAKAKQMLRREADPRAAGDESPSESSPSDHQEDSLVSEYYGSNQQSLPLRASSATFPAMDHHQSQQQHHQQPALSIYPPANDGSLSHSTSPGSADEYPSPGSHHEMTYSMSGYMAPVQQQPQHNHHHHHYEQSYVPTTASMGIEIESMEPMMAQVGSFQAELLSIDDVPQLDKDLIVMPSCEVTQLDPNNRQVSPGSAASESESSPVLRLKSPPPPANLASRRNKGAPSLLSSLSGMNSMSSLNSAFRGTYGGSRVQKHAPRSPFFGNGNKEALLQAVSATKTASPITPSSALLDETNSNSEYDGLPMQANPSSTSWSAYTDEALLTPSLASYGSDDFASLMHAGAPGYLGHMGSQPPTPSVTQPLGHGYFPVTTTSAQDYTFPGEYGMLAASSVKSSPSQSKKQFQFTQNVTPQDYSC